MITANSDKQIFRTDVENLFLSEMVMEDANFLIDNNDSSDDDMVVDNTSNELFADDIIDDDDILEDEDEAEDAIFSSYF
jgi:hypothetical protein